MADTSTPPVLAFVGSAGRSGSTLLDLLLNNAPHVQSLGEFHRVTHDARTDGETCTCGETIDACPFWQAVEAEGRKRLGNASGHSLLHELDPMLRPEDVRGVRDGLQRLSLLLGVSGVHAWFEKVVAPAHSRAVRNSLFWYDVVRTVSGASVIVDSTKDVRRLKSLYLAQPEMFRLIYLVRDGRAVTASNMRRTGKTMELAARRWRQINARIQMASLTIPASRKMLVRYEDLCADTEDTLHAICDFLAMPFSPAMARLNKSVAHNIGGNPMRFRRGEQEVAIDERWRGQLSPSDLATFERVAGAMNRKLGYSAP